MLLCLLLVLSWSVLLQCFWVHPDVIWVDMSLHRTVVSRGWCRGIDRDRFIAITRLGFGLGANGIRRGVASLVLLPEDGLPVVEAETRSGREIESQDMEKPTDETLRS
jgi:hypothetical protein